MFFSTLRPPESKYFWVHKKNAVDESILSTIDDYMDKQNLNQGETVGNHECRDSRIHWMTDQRYQNLLMPVYNDITSMVESINDRNWRYIIDGWEPFQYAEYDESYRGYFDWHIDLAIPFKSPSQPLSRKLSFSLGLSDRNDYEGGGLIINFGKEKTFKLGRGEIVIFPSWMLHKVAPVTTGKRKVIVGWGLGSII